VVVQPDLGVGEVIVVDQHQVRTALAGQLGYLGQLAGHVGLHLTPPDERARARPRAVVQPDRDPVRAQHRVAGRRLLPDREAGDRAVRAGLVIGAQRVDARGLQPGLRPPGQIPAGGFLERGEQIVQRRVAPGMSVEVAAQRGQEVVPAYVGDQLLEHGRALGVGDAVEVHLYRVDVGNVGRDGVRGRQLVLPVRPALVQLRERGPRR
jgi:hypothetical protein